MSIASMRIGAVCTCINDWIQPGIAMPHVLADRLLMTKGATCCIACTGASYPLNDQAC